MSDMDDADTSDDAFRRALLALTPEQRETKPTLVGRVKRHGHIMWQKIEEGVTRQQIADLLGQHRGDPVTAETLSATLSRHAPKKSLPKLPPKRPARPRQAGNSIRTSAPQVLAPSAPPPQPRLKSSARAATQGDEDHSGSAEANVNGTAAPNEASPHPDHNHEEGGKLDRADQDQSPSKSFEPRETNAAARPSGARLIRGPE